jgi:ribosomal protein S18 acetylase RimI-like enzyme
MEMTAKNIKQYVVIMPETGPEAPGTPGTGPEAPGMPETGPEAPGTPGTGPEAPGMPETGPEAPGTPGTGPEAPGMPETGPEAPGTPGTGPEAPGTPGTGPEAPGTPGTGPEALDNVIKIIRTENLVYDETIHANTSEQLTILGNEYKKKFTIELINNSPDNLTHHNLKNLIRVLEQLSCVDIPDINEISKLLMCLDYGIINKKYLLVVKYEDQIIGTGSILVEDKIIHGMGKVGHVEDIVIDKKFRGLGLARQLMEKLIQIAKDKQCYKIILATSDDTVQFYEKIGFKKHSSCMRLDLK